MGLITIRVMRWGRSSLRDSLVWRAYPALTRWAKFGRPFGTLTETEMDMETRDGDGGR